MFPFPRHDLFAVQELRMLLFLSLSDIFLFHLVTTNILRNSVSSARLPCKFDHPGCLETPSPFAHT